MAKQLPEQNVRLLRAPQLDVLLRPESAHENEHRGKWKKKITATVIDIVSKCKISIQVPHTEIVRW